MRILVAETRTKTRFALRTLLEQLPGIDVVGEATDAEELLTQTGKARPDIVLLDWGLRGLSRVSRTDLRETAVGDLLTALHNLGSRLYVIVLDGRPETRQAALTAGADDFVSKVDPPDRLLTAIEKALGCGFRANSRRVRYA
jgi:DNA-binding NarL/FixJ family response regulator